MMDEKETPICRLCGGKVEVSLNWYATEETWRVVQEGMHWICYHTIYEHFAEPDEPCGDPACLWRRIRAYEDKLRELGLDPIEVNLDWEDPKES